MNFQKTATELLGTARYIMTTYISDLSDEEILVSPVEGAHHSAWQLGHLIASESRMAGGVRTGAGIELPSGFEATHGKESGYGEQSGFLTLAVYRELLERQRAQTLHLLLSLTDEDLARPAPEFMRAYAPTVASVFLSIGSHELMHAGQIAVVRRRLQKPILI